MIYLELEKDLLLKKSFEALREFLLFPLETENLFFLVLPTGL